MRLIDIDDYPDSARILYDLLAERPAEAAISHKVMPSYDEHLTFVAEHPYQAWYLLEEVVGDEGTFIVGAVYLSAANEIGVAIFQRWARRGYGQHAVRCLMAKHGPMRYLANVAPANVPSRELFEGLGFRHIQNTFELQT
jgi:RimJ/RimL family protein N-acetyltransferase